MARQITRARLSGRHAAHRRRGVGGGGSGGCGSPYPPARPGLSGQTEPSFHVLHALRDGTFWDKAGTPEATGETYDLVVVGAATAGLRPLSLSPAGRPKARVLLLETSDDFGGHARRNEFTASNGAKIIGYAGSQSLQTPSYFSPAVHKLLRDIAVDLDKFETYYDQDWARRHKLGPAAFFSREQFGADRLVKITERAADWVPETPLNEKARRDLIELVDHPRDYLAGKSRAEKLDILASTTYARFLTDICTYDPQLVTYFQDSTEGILGVGADAIAALDAWGDGEPGFEGMDLGDAPHRMMSASARRAFTDIDPYIFHFPDGNAGIARALLRAMIPGAIPGRGMESLVVAQGPIRQARHSRQQCAPQARCAGGESGACGRGSSDRNLCRQRQAQDRRGGTCGCSPAGIASFPISARSSRRRRSTP